MPLSKTFITAVKMSTKRHYQLANEACIHPSLISKWINGIQRPQENDPRVLRIGQSLGLATTEIFCDPLANTQASAGKAIGNRRQAKQGLLKKGGKK